MQTRRDCYVTFVDIQYLGEELDELLVGSVFDWGRGDADPKLARFGPTDHFRARRSLNDFHRKRQASVGEVINLFHLFWSAETGCPV